MDYWKMKQSQRKEADQQQLQQPPIDENATLPNKPIRSTDHPSVDASSTNKYGASPSSRRRRRKKKDTTVESALSFQFF